MSQIMKFVPLALKNLFSPPATRDYPNKPKQFVEGSRGHIVNDFDNCILCGACQRKCPSNAITVDRKNKTWKINRMSCVQCSNCVIGCPKKCLSIVPGYTEPSGKPSIVVHKKPPEKKPDTSGSLTNDIEKCILCGLCQRNCPQGAITVDRKGEKSWTVDHEKCVKCGLCLSKCPRKSLSFTGTNKGIEVHKK